MRTFLFDKIYLHLPEMIIARRKQCFRGTLANFYKCKKWIIFNVDYRPGSKKSKFDMILIRHSPLKKVFMTLFAQIRSVTIYKILILIDYKIIFLNFSITYKSQNNTSRYWKMTETKKMRLNMFKCSKI